MSETVMRAVQFDRAGGPEVLRVRDVPAPTPGSGQILVRVRAASVNPADILSRRSRIGGFPRGTGMDYAGDVAAVGPGVDDLRPGDRVWGFLGTGRRPVGAAADYLIATRDQVAAAPASIALVEAAALPTVGLTALQALRTLRLHDGDRLLVVGASGGVGSAAVQLGRAMGAAVTAVAGARSGDLVRDLGADRVLDYASIDSHAPEQDFDALIDCHGGSISRYRRMLRRSGRGVTVAAKGFPFALLSRVLPGPSIGVVIVKPSRNDTQALTRYVDDGHLRPVIDTTYPLAAIQDAHRAVETGHAHGKRVIDLRALPPSRG
ncbi:NADP-dependent oxidoreductase [Nonomuraea angiospora]|uniref:NADP-dependent oxidoreductase n=1 Tax=Nonomuraea angiospora TaxID=46172 RepID=UPI0033DEABF5